MRGRIKFVAVDEPTTNDGPDMPSGFTERSPQGEVVAMLKIVETYKFVVVAFVVVAFPSVKFVIVEVALLTKIPPVKELSPLKVLVLARRVEEAALIVMSPEPLKETPLMFLAVSNSVAVPALPPMFNVEVEVKARAVPPELL